MSDTNAPMGGPQSGGNRSDEDTGKMLLIRWIPIIILVGGLGYYIGISQESTPTGGLIIPEINQELMTDFGREAMDSVLAKYPEAQLPSARSRVERLGADLSRATESLGYTPRGYRWQYKTIDTNKVLAAAFPGGGVIVSTGMLRHLGDDDQLAFIIAREMAHEIELQSNTRAPKREVGPLEATTLNGLKPAQKEIILGAIGIGTEFGLRRPYSLQEDLNANATAARLYGHACFDPDAIAQSWATLVNAYNASVERFDYVLLHPRMSDFSRTDWANFADYAEDERRRAGCS